MKCWIQLFSHAAFMQHEFNHWNNPVFTAQSAYCKSANRSTFFISDSLDSVFCTKVHSVILKNDRVDKCFTL